MLKPLYLIWAILPAFFFYFALKAFLRPYFTKRGGKESPKAYLRQAGFTALFLVLAVLLDRYFVFDFLRGQIKDKITLVLVQFFTYPVLMFLAAWVQKVVNREAGEVGKSEYKPRVRY